MMNDNNLEITEAPNIPSIVGPIKQNNKFAFSNHVVLVVTCSLFALFVIAIFIGALVKYSIF